MSGNSNAPRILITGGSGFIGTHLVEDYLIRGVELINIDIKAPTIPAHFLFWRECNILDTETLERVFSEFQPTQVVHLAARANTTGKTLHDYLDNTVGTQNVLAVVKRTPSIMRVIITSSQHVRRPGSGYPNSPFDFEPHGLYGQSKVITEKLTDEAGLGCNWMIIRPTTVWGPGHMGLKNGLWRYMKKGLYFHPVNDPVIRNYGYVKNLVWQIEGLLEAPAGSVDKKVFYTGDETGPQMGWINAFSMALSGRPVLLVPKALIHLLAGVGDIFARVGLKFPMDGRRFFNLTTTNPVDISPIYELLGKPPYCLEKGIQETLLWLEDENSLVNSYSAKLLKSYR